MTAMCSPRDVSLSEMQLLRSLTGQGRRPNMLVVCPDADVRAVFEQVRGVLGLPFSVCLLPGPLDLAASGRAPLFIHDIAALTPSQQISLYDWLSARGSEVQVVSMTASPLLPLVQAGKFLEGLFYRLNTISTVAASA